MEQQVQALTCFKQELIKVGINPDSLSTCSNYNYVKKLQEVLNPEVLAYIDNTIRSLTELHNSIRKTICG